MARLVIPTLMYHSVAADSRDYLTVSTQVFESHVRHLADACTVVGIRDMLNPHFDRVPDRPVAITFDDSLRNALDQAVPILEAFAQPATFFVIAGTIGQTNAWDTKAYQILDHMTVEDLQYLARKGFEIGGHSVTHQRLTKLPLEHIEHEVRQSKEMLTRILDREPVAFAYPYGDADERCRQICARHYPLGFASVRQGVFDWREEPTNIRRIYVSPDDGVVELDRKIEAYRNFLPC